MPATATARRRVPILGEAARRAVELPVAEQVRRLQRAPLTVGPVDVVDVATHAGLPRIYRGPAGGVRTCLLCCLPTVDDVCGLCGV